MSPTTHEQNVARGLKAALHNDHVSVEAKENAAQRLERMGEIVPSDLHLNSNHLSSNQERGYKSVLSRDDTSSEAKAHAREMLNGTGSEMDHVGHAGGEHDNRVLGGYKATLKNPNVSEEAKEHAAQVLDENGAL